MRVKTVALRFKAERLKAKKIGMRKKGSVQANKNGRVSMKDLKGKSYIYCGFYVKRRLFSENYCIYDIKEPNPVKLSPLPLVKHF